MKGVSHGKQIKESVNFKTGTIPTIDFGTIEQRKFFKQLLEYKKAVSNSLVIEQF